MPEALFPFFHEINEIVTSNKLAKPTRTPKVETIKTVKEVTKTIVGGNSKKDYIIGRYNTNNMYKMLYKIHNKDVFYYYKNNTKKKVNIYSNKNIY